MSEKELDSSVNEYEEQYKSSNYVKQLQWDMAIGLQEVDNLKPSKYLEKLLEKEVEGNLTIEEVEKELREYFTGNGFSFRYVTDDICGGVRQDPYWVICW